MKNINTMLKTIQKTIKTSKIVKMLTLWFNKFAKFSNLKPKQLVILLGLLLVSLATLGLGMIGGKREGFGTITELEELEKKRIKIVDAMNCAINNSTTLQVTRDTMRANINAWFTSYITYLMQGDDFNLKNNMDSAGNNNRKIHKIKNSSDISGTTRPKYIDDKDIASIAPGDLIKYELVYVYEKGRVDTNNYTITTGDNKIYKIRDETKVSATMPKYIDNVPVLPATTTNETPSLATYSLIDIKVPIGKNAVDSAETSIKTTDFNINAISKDKLIKAFDDIKKYAEEYFSLINSPTSNGIEGFATADVNLILNQGTRYTVTERDIKQVDPCNVVASAASASADGAKIHCSGSWTEIDTCKNGSIKKKYKVTRNASNGGDICGYLHDEVRNFACVNGVGSAIEEDEIIINTTISGNYAIPESITNPSLLRDYLNKIETDFTNADKWKQLYINELKRRNDYIKYANTHNATYHKTGVNTNTQQGSQGRQTTQGYDNLTGSGKVGVPPGDEDLYMLKSRMVPPTNPPGSGNSMQGGSGMQSGNSMQGGSGMQGGNSMQSEGSDQGLSTGSGCNRPAPVPPCPPCERCPEPAFDCKRVPNYNSVTSNQYLPRPVLTDFSQFGM